MSIDETTQSRDTSPTITNDLSTDRDNEDNVTDDDAKGDTDHSSSEHEDNATDNDEDNETGSFHSATSQANAEAWASTGAGWQATSTNNMEAVRQADNQWVEWGDMSRWPQRHQTWQELTMELMTATPELDPDEMSISTVQRIIDNNDPSIADHQKVVDWFQQITQREPQDISSIKIGEALVLVQCIFAHDKNSWKPLNRSGGQQEYASPFPG